MRFFKLVLVPFVFLVLFRFIPIVHADRGGFPIVVGERVSESGQKAIIAWNGTHEILVLSTDVSSTKESEVVEIMPLPSNPTISKGENQSFLKVQELVNEYFVIESILSGGWIFPYRGHTAGGLGEFGEEPPKIIITFQETIGVHDLTVVEAEEAGELIQWLQNFLETKGYERELPSNLEELLQHYVEDGMKFFVIDMIKTSSTVKTIDPLMYEFESSRLYYPLRISTLFSGDTEISLFTLTSNTLDDDSITKEGLVKKAQFQIKQETLAEISPNITKLFSDNPYLCYFSFAGSLEEFNGDILAPFQVSQDIFTLSLTIFIPSFGLLSLFLFFPANKISLHLENNGLSASTRLKIVFSISGLAGIFFIWVGCWFLPWGLRAYGDLLIPNFGLYGSTLDSIIMAAILIPLMFATPPCIYLLLFLSDSKDASSILTAGGIYMMLLVLMARIYCLYSLDIGAYSILTGSIFLILTGLLIRLRMKL